MCLVKILIVFNPITLSGDTKDGQIVFIPRVEQKVLKVSWPFYFFSEVSVAI